MSRASSFNFKNFPPSRGAGAIHTAHWVQTIFFLAVGALLSWPLVASAEDSTLMQGYCGPMPPNSWFQFSSSTVSAVHSQLISTLTARAYSSYDVAVASYPGYPIPGCTVQVTARPPSTYCTSPLDCKVQIDGEVQTICGGQSSTPALNTFVIEGGGCMTALASTPPPKPKVVAIDPGHGFNCPANGMALGAIGVTDFLPGDPPAGRLREDDLTMAIAREVQRILPTSKYRVVLTKRDANECPDFWERGLRANRQKAKVFVSIHINRALVVPVTDWPLPVAHGTSVHYNVEKSGSFNLADSLARNVSSRLGVNNRGVMVDDELAVLKKKVTEMDAVLVESARLSGTDEIRLHASGSATRIATAIKAALDESLGN